MIHHIIKLIWNRRRSLTWIFIEQILVFGVLLFVFGIFSESLSRYFEKGNIKVDNIVYINFSKSDREETEKNETDALNNQFRNMVESMKDWQSVELISFNRIGALPVTTNTRADSISYKDNKYRASIKYCDENYYKMFSPKLIEGEWFTDSDATSEIPPALITQQLADNLKLTGSAIGQIVEHSGITYRICGIVEAFKDRLVYDPLSAIFMPASLADDYWECEIGIKHKQKKGSDFAKEFLAEFYKNFPKDQFKPLLMDLYKLDGQNTFFNISLHLYLMGIPAAFLLIFAFMGTFGVVWMQSKKRIGELGLRIALGCPPARMQRTIIAENLILTGFAMLPGLIVAANLFAFAQEGWEFPIAVGTAVVLMLCFSAFSAWYPARQAAKVQPVEALRANQ